jgi:hypothetical protein
MIHRRSVQNNKEESSNEAEARHPQHPAHNRGNKSSSWNLVLYLVIVLLLVDKYNYSKREAAVVNGVGDNKDETKLSLQQQHGSDSTTSSSSCSIDAMQAMDWTIPADILKLSGRLDHTGLTSLFSFWRAGQTDAPKDVRSRCLLDSWCETMHALHTASEQNVSEPMRSLFSERKKLKPTKPNNQVESLYRRRFLSSNVRN